MMKKTTGLAIGLSLLSAVTVANCDLTRYHWDCELNIHTKPTSAAHSLVYCGDVYGYMTTAQYDTLIRYQRANVNMSLVFNGSYIDGPCIPSGR